jgi:hypothetical protein
MGRRLVTVKLEILVPICIKVTSYTIYNSIIAPFAEKGKKKRCKKEIVCAMLPTTGAAYFVNWELLETKWLQGIKFL